MLNSEMSHEKLDRHDIKDADTVMYFFIYNVPHWVEHFDKIVKRSFQVKEKNYIAKALHNFIFDEMHSKSQEIKSFGEIEALLI